MSATTISSARPRLKHNVLHSDGERNVQWTYANGIVISWLYRYGRVWEVWGWPAGEGQNRPLTPDPIGVRDAIDAYEQTNWLLARAERYARREIDR